MFSHICNGHNHATLETWGYLVLIVDRYLPEATSLMFLIFVINVIDMIDTTMLWALSTDKISSVLLLLCV